MTMDPNAAISYKLAVPEIEPDDADQPEAEPDWELAKEQPITTEEER